MAILRDTTMANYSRSDDAKSKRQSPAAETRADVEHDLALGQLIYDLRTGAGLSQPELAERMGTTRSETSGWRKAAARRTGSTPSPAWPRRWADTWSCRSPRRSRPS